MLATRNRKAFTLIELLVVIAIIAILAAILFPVFMTAKKAGQAKACLGNAKQLGMASVLYADDHGGFLVPAITGEYKSDPKFPNLKYWTKILYPYVRSRSAYVCPAMLKEAKAEAGETNSMPCTYAMNAIVISCDSDWQGLGRRHSMGEYRRPSKIILLTEIRERHWTTGSGILESYNLHKYAPRWHNDRLNVAFLDGHAVTMYLYDTIGSIATEWMWHDPAVNKEGGDAKQIETDQVRLKNNWPSDYPPKSQ